MSSNRTHTRGRNRNRAIVAGGVAALAVLTSPFAAGADPLMTRDGAPLTDGGLVVGEVVTINTTACTGPGQTYGGFFAHAAHQPLAHEHEVATEPDGSWTWSSEVSGDTEAGVYTLNFYCASSPIESVDDPAITWLSGDYHLEVQPMAEPIVEVNASRIASVGGTAADEGMVQLSIDPNALPRVDEMGIPRAQAAGLKAKVDARRTNVGQAQRLYLAFLGRPGDRAAMAAFDKPAVQSATYAKLATSLARTSEFERRYGRLTDAAFVDAAHRNVLGRAADRSTRTALIEQLRTRRTTRTAVLVGLAGSKENIARTANLTYVLTAHKVVGTTSPTLAKATAQAQQLDSGMVPKVQIVEDIALGR
ncbi:MAG TPA: DUF4214 domain-containing protein [Aquihabitans sp.]|jgi:hypothetical protein|nr:DUF4214 domain-containing protein [Aquihabitans sp.]